MGTHPYFTRDEFVARTACLHTRMRAAGADVALVDEFESMAWLTGYGNSENRWRCVAIPLAGQPFYFIRALDAGPCRNRVWFDDVVTFKDWEDPMQGLARALNARRLATARIGVNLASYCLSAARFEAMQAALPGARFVDLGALVDELRLIKSPAEIGLMRRASHIADEALRKAATECVCGGSLSAAAKAAMATFIDLGAEADRPGPISRARGWDFLHGHPDDEAVVSGDVVHLEMVPRVGGYSARVMRCVAVGTPPVGLVRVAEQLAALQDKQLAAIRPGVVAEDIDAVLRDGLVAAGLRESVDNITGYSLGYYSHATPRTSDFTRVFCPGARWRIEPNMLFHMYVSAAGVSFSETVLVTATSAERLTLLPRSLVVNR